MSDTIADSKRSLSPLEKPFIIELDQSNRTPDGSFTPTASLKITAALRTSGLLRALPPEDVAWLMFLLTFLSPNGECSAHLALLSEAMHVSKQKAEKRMNHLASFQWQGYPLVVVTRHDSGLISYAVSPHALAYEHKAPSSSPEPPLTRGFRDRIIEHSRATYARPRAEVEGMVAAQYGYHGVEQEETPAIQHLRYELENVGITSDQAGYLTAAYDQERIERQLAWLPYRHAKNPAGFLIAAIENDYAEPPAVRFAGTESAEATATSAIADSGKTSYE